MPPDDRELLKAWLPRLGGPEFKGDEDRKNAIAEMQAAGKERLFPILIELLNDSDLENRCVACEAILRVNSLHGLPIILAVLTTSDDYLRWYACECVVTHGDVRAVPELLRLLKFDKDPMIRGSAARGLGIHGGIAVVPDLIATLDRDHEVDELGFSPSHCAATALDDILGTEETRLKINGFCRLPDKAPDLIHLRSYALERYRQYHEHSTPM